MFKKSKGEEMTVVQVLAPFIGRRRFRLNYFSWAVG